MIHRSLFILGRQPTIGAAELESLFGGNTLEYMNEYCIASSMSPTEISFDRIGSSIKLASYIDTVFSSRWQDVKAALPGITEHCAEEMYEGKVKIGVSAYGFPAKPSELVATGLEIKKYLRAHGYSVRLVPNKESALNSAQVLHNNLTGERGIELLVVRAGSKTIIGRTQSVQDIAAYARRDQERPKRDAFVGMLPPKLAQTIVNLAVGQTKPAESHVVLDPFCGTGVILQETLLMGYAAQGSDLDQRMVDYTSKNISWLAAKSSIGSPSLEVGDATAHHWQQPFSCIASEVYLGHPLSSWPTPDKLTTIVGNCNLIIEKFLRNVARQTPGGLRLCLAVPVWINPNNGGKKHLPMLDHLGVLGYNRVSFQQVAESTLLYYRPGQLVGRELLVLTTK